MRTHERSFVELVELTANAAHEIREPLTAIGAHAAACANWLSADPSNVDELRAALAAIAAEVQRANAIIEQVSSALGAAGSALAAEAES